MGGGFVKHQRKNLPCGYTLYGESMNAYEKEPRNGR